MFKRFKECSNLNKAIVILVALISLSLSGIIILLLWKGIKKFCLWIKGNPTTKPQHFNLDRRNLPKDTKAYSLKISKKKMDKFKLQCLKNGSTYISTIDNFISNYKGGRSHA